MADQTANNLSWTFTWNVNCEDSIPEEFGFSGWDNKKLNTCVIYMYTITKLFPHTLVYEHTPTCTQTPTSSMREICFPGLPKKQKHMDYYFNTFTQHLRVARTRCYKGITKNGISKYDAGRNQIIDLKIYSAKVSWQRLSTILLWVTKSQVTLINYVYV